MNCGTSLLVMIRTTAFKLQSFSNDLFFHLFIFRQEKACSHGCMWNQIVTKVWQQSFLKCENDAADKDPYNSNRLTTDVNFSYVPKGRIIYSGMWPAGRSLPTPDV